MPTVVELLHRPELLFAIIAFGVIASWVFTRLVTRLVIRRVFGSTQLPTVADTTRQVQQAQRDATRAIRDVRAQTEAALAQAREDAASQVAELHASVREDVERMTEQVQNNEIPLALAVNSAEDRQVLEAMISRSPRVVYRQAQTKNPSKADKERRAIPTAWERILQDEDEEGTVCPKIPEPEAPKTAPPKAKTPKQTARPKSGGGRTRKG